MKLLKEDIREKPLNVKKGDVFKDFFKNSDALVLYANKIVRDKSLAEDIVQDVFEKLWNDADKITITGSIRAYILMTLRNHCLNSIKHRQVEQKYLGRNEIEMDEIMHVDIWFEESDLEAKLRASLEKLPPQTRKIFWMSRFEECSNTEIAWRLGIKKRTVEVQISNALRILRQELKDIIKTNF